MSCQDAEHQFPLRRGLPIGIGGSRFDAPRRTSAGALSKKEVVEAVVEAAPQTKREGSSSPLRSAAICSSRHA